MPQLPPPLRDQRKVDEQHLKTLSVLHFVGAGLAVLGLLFLLGHYALFQAVFSDPKIWADQKHGPRPDELFAIFRWFYLVAGIWFVGSGILNLMSGFFIRARKRRVLSIVVAGSNCLHMPLGTVLGVFTIVVLMRDSVRELYDAMERKDAPRSD